MTQPSPILPILKLIDVEKVYHSGHRELKVVDQVSLDIMPGESLAIIGPSGSGKTTLLGLCAGLDSPSRGQIQIDGHALEQMSEDQRAALRNEKVGFVFQNFQLIVTLTALENVCLPLELRGERRVRERALHWLEQVGLKERADHYPVQLSGGEQQRVAIARSCVGDPQILFADEPTGNLDDATSEQIEDLLFEKHAAIQNTLVLVTHDQALARRCDRILRIRAGRVEELSKGALEPAKVSSV